MAKNRKKTCFVITPVGNEEDPIRRQIDGIINAVLIPVLGDDYEIIVSHQLQDTGSVHKQVIQYIYDSDLVIANLTKKHPIVIYELAFRHSIGTPVIMIAEKGTSLPCFFAEKAIYYINDAQGVLELIEKLMSHLDLIDYARDREGPIYDALRDTAKEEYLVKKTGKEYPSLANMNGGDKIAEINETEYAFFRDLLREKTRKPAETKPEYENYILKEEAKMEEPAMPDKIFGNGMSGDVTREITEPVTLEQIRRNTHSHEKEVPAAGADLFLQDGRADSPVHPEFKFLNHIVLSNDLPEKVEADFASIREIIKETKKEIGDVPARCPNSLRSIFDEEKSPKGKADRDTADTVLDIMDRLERIASKITKVAISSEDHFKDLIEKNEYLHKVINFNHPYNEMNNQAVK